MTDSSRKWDEIYRDARQNPYGAAPVLTENACLLPVSGRALDLACGLGANAVYLAEHGLDVLAVDQSAVAVECLQIYGSEHRLSIMALKQNVDSAHFPDSGFDVIVVSRFLNRSLSDAILKALNPGGLLYYQTYTREKADNSGPMNPDFLLAENELLDLFAPLRVVYYRENGLIGDCRQGLRSEAQFIGCKRQG